MSEQQEIEISRKVPECLNCGRHLKMEDYCPQCGQKNTDRNIGLRALINDFMGDYFSFDSKFFRTFIPLFTQPGSVPKEFMNGQRVKHISPLRILIFSSFIFFFMWGVTFSPSAEDSRSISSVIKENIEHDKLKTSTADSSESKKQSISLDEHNFIQLTMDEDTAEGSSVEGKMKKIFALLDEGLSIPHAVDSIAKGNNEFETKLYTQIAKMYSSNRSTIVKYFIGNLSIVILIIQPFFALLLKLLYVRKRKQYRFIGHLVFSLYLHSWILLLLTIGILINQVWPGFSIAPFALFLSFVYLLFASKRFYEQRWFKTTLKSILMLMLYLFIIAPMFFIGSFAASFFFF